MMQAAGVAPGDPQLAATAIIAITDETDPPLRLPLGNDALALLRRGYRAPPKKPSAGPMLPTPPTSTVWRYRMWNMPSSSSFRVEPPPDETMGPVGSNGHALLSAMSVLFEHHNAVGCATDSGDHGCAWPS